MSAQPSTIEDLLGIEAQAGDRLARLTKVYAATIDIYHTPERARDFLRRPHMMLDNEAPLDVAMATEPGADAVVNLLGRAAYGGGV